MTRSVHDELDELFAAPVDPSRQRPDPAAVFVRSLRTFTVEPAPVPRADLARVLLRGGVPDGARPTRRPAVGLLVTRRLRRPVRTLAIMAATLGVTAGLAAADALPGPIQRAVVDVAGKVGIDLEGRSGPPAPRVPGTTSPGGAVPAAGDAGTGGASTPAPDTPTTSTLPPGPTLPGGVMPPPLPTLPLAPPLPLPPLPPTLPDDGTLPPLGS